MLPENKMDDWMPEFVSPNPYPEAGDSGQSVSSAATAGVLGWPAWIFHSMLGYIELYQASP